MIKKIVSYVVVVCMIVSMFSSCLTGFAAGSSDGNVIIRDYVPGVDNGVIGHGTKISVETTSDGREYYYSYKSLTGASDAPLGYIQITSYITELTFMLTDAGSTLGLMPTFYDAAKSGSDKYSYTPMLNISANNGVVISNITDASGEYIFSDGNSNWSDNKLTLTPTVTMNKKHTIRIEHDPDNLRFTVRFDSYKIDITENAESALVESTATASGATNAKGPRFLFAASQNQTFRVYNMYIRGTQASNTSTSETAKIFSGARAYTYPGELKVTETLPANNAYGIKADAKDMYIKFNHPLASEQNDFAIDISYSSDGTSYTDVASDGYTHAFAPSESTLDISFDENLKRGVKYKIEIEKVYSDEGNPLASYTFYFNTDDGTAEILNAVNNAASLRNLGLALNEYKSDIGLADADYANVNANRNVLSWVYNQKPYTQVSQIKAAAESAAEMKTALDLVTESSVTTFVDSYHNDLFEDQTAHEKYSGLSAVYKAMADNMIAATMPFNTLIDFIDAFEASVNSISVEVSADSASADKLICDFTKTGMSGWTASKSDYSFINEATPDFAPGVTLGRYYIPETTPNQYRMDFELPYNDVSDCEALYIWAYSPAASGKQFVLVPFCEDTPSWVYFSKLMTIDFSGWKLITIPLSSFSGVRNPSWSDLKDIRIAQAGMGLTEAAGGTEIYFAKMWFGAKASANSFLLVSSNAQNGTQNFGAADTLEYNFSGEVYFNPGNPPYIADSAGNKISAEVSANGNTLLIDPVASLAPNTAYTVHLSDVCTYGALKYQSAPITFTTAGNGLSAGMPQLSVSSLPASGSVSAAVDISNSHSSAIDAELIIAAYDQNGRMIGMSSNECRIGAGESGKMAVCTISLPSYAGVTLKCFVINKTDNNKPVNQKFAVIKASDAPADKTYASFDKGAAFADGNLTIKNISVDLDRITVKSCINQNMGVPLTVKVSDSAGNVKYISQISTDTNGCSTAQFSLDPDLDGSGRYKVEITSSSMTNASPATSFFYYIDSADRAIVLNSVNSATSKGSVASVINANKQLMSVANVDYTHVNNMYISHIIYRDKPYGSYDQLLGKYKKAVAVLGAINDAYWSSYTDVIESNKDIIFDNLEVYNSYNALDTNDKNKVSQNVYTKKPFKSFAAFVDEISDEIEGLGTKTPSTGPSAPSSPKGGYTTDGSATIIPEVSGGDIYVDLADCAWAQDYIYTLKDKGVLTMGADRRFRPNDNITREEYVKMLVMALGITLGGDVDFDDVNKADWYYTYVAAACNAGIVNGMEVRRFGTGEYITREQMATMACRALKISDFALASSNAFSDDNEISEYAKDAVYYMQNNGIINGIGNNTFAPKSNASRAQAAKIISMISDL